jgi:predicted dinucleotide-utilizing enzyme
LVASTRARAVAAALRDVAHALDAIIAHTDLKIECASARARRVVARDARRRLRTTKRVRVSRVAVGAGRSTIDDASSCVDRQRRAPGVDI